MQKIQGHDFKNKYSKKLLLFITIILFFSCNKNFRLHSMERKSLQQRIKIEQERQSLVNNNSKRERNEKSNVFAIAEYEEDMNIGDTESMEQDSQYQNNTMRSNYQNNDFELQNHFFENDQYISYPDSNYNDNNYTALRSLMPYKIDAIRFDKNYNQLNSVDKFMISMFNNQILNSCFSLSGKEEKILDLNIPQQNNDKELEYALNNIIKEIEKKIFIHHIINNDNKLEIGKFTDHSLDPSNKPHHRFHKFVKKPGLFSNQKKKNLQLTIDGSINCISYSMSQILEERFSKKEINILKKIRDYKSLINNLYLECLKNESLDKKRIAIKSFLIVFTSFFHVEAGIQTKEVLLNHFKNFNISENQIYLFFKNLDNPSITSAIINPEIDIFSNAMFNIMQQVIEKDINNKSISIYKKRILFLSFQSNNLINILDSIWESEGLTKFGKKDHEKTEKEAKKNILYKSCQLIIKNISHAIQNNIFEDFATLFPQIINEWLTNPFSTSPKKYIHNIDDYIYIVENEILKNSKNEDQFIKENTFSLSLGIFQKFDKDIKKTIYTEFWQMISNFIINFNQYIDNSSKDTEEKRYRPNEKDKKRSELKEDDFDENDNDIIMIKMEEFLSKDFFIEQYINRGNLLKEKLNAIYDTYNSKFIEILETLNHFREYNEQEEADINESSKIILQNERLLKILADNKENIMHHLKEKLDSFIPSFSQSEDEQSSYKQKIINQSIFKPTYNLLNIFITLKKIMNDFTEDLHEHKTNSFKKLEDILKIVDSNKYDKETIKQITLMYERLQNSRKKSIDIIKNYFLNKNNENNLLFMEDIKKIIININFNTTFFFEEADIRQATEMENKLEDVDFKDKYNQDITKIFNVLKKNAQKTQSLFKTEKEIFLGKNFNKNGIMVFYTNNFHDAMQIFNNGQNYIIADYLPKNFIFELKNLTIQVKDGQTFLIFNDNNFDATKVIYLHIHIERMQFNNVFAKNNFKEKLPLNNDWKDETTISSMKDLNYLLKNLKINDNSGILKEKKSLFALKQNNNNNNRNKNEQENNLKLSQLYKDSGSEAVKEIIITFVVNNVMNISSNPVKYFDNLNDFTCWKNFYYEGEMENYFTNNIADDYFQNLYQKIQDDIYFLDFFMKNMNHYFLKSKNYSINNKNKNIPFSIQNNECYDIIKEKLEKATALFFQYLKLDKHLWILAIIKNNNFAEAKISDIFLKYDVIEGNIRKQKMKKILDEYKKVNKILYDYLSNQLREFSKRLENQQLLDNQTERSFRSNNDMELNEEIDLIKQFLADINNLEKINFGEETKNLIVLIMRNLLIKKYEIFQTLFLDLLQIDEFYPSLKISEELMELEDKDASITSLNDACSYLYLTIVKIFNSTQNKNIDSPTVLMILSQLMYNKNEINNTKESTGIVNIDDMKQNNKYELLEIINEHSNF